MDGLRKAATKLGLPFNRWVERDSSVEAWTQQRQAKGGRIGMKYYSCDSHVVEAREVFEGLEAQFGSRAPRVERNFNGKPGDWIVLPGTAPVPVGRLGIAGNRLDDPKTDEKIALGYDGLNPGVKDPHARLDEQTLDGVCGEVMYPSLNMFTFAIKDRDVVSAVFERHNDWVFDYCSAAPERLLGIGCLGLPDIDIALAEMKRAATKGVRGFAIPAHVEPDKPYHHADFDPFWAAAEDFGVPLTMHIFTGSSFDGGMPKHWGTPGGTIKGYTLSHTTAVNTDDRPDLRRRGRAVPPPQVRDQRVRGRLVGAHPSAAGPCPLPNPEVRRGLPDDEAVATTSAAISTPPSKTMRPACSPAT